MKYTKSKKYTLNHNYTNILQIFYKSLKSILLK